MAPAAPERREVADCADAGSCGTPPRRAGPENHPHVASRGSDVALVLHAPWHWPPYWRLELPGQWRPVTVQRQQENGERLRKYKRKYNKLRGVVPGCPTISGDSEDSLQAKERRKQRNKMRRAGWQAQQAAEKKQWEQQQQDLLRQIAPSQAAQAAQPAEPPVQPPAPVAPAQALPPKISDQPEAQAQPPQIANQPEGQAEPARSADQPGAQAQEQGRAMQPQTEESQASSQLWKDPKVCSGGALQCPGNQICASYTPGNTTNSDGGLWVTELSGTRPRLHTG